MVKKERTEEQIVAMAPLVVILGGEKYDIPPLVIRDSRAWRQKVVPFLTPLPKKKGEGYDVALKEILVTMPDTVLNLFFDYAKTLDREKIESVATEAEVLEAFSQVVAVGFPLSKSLSRAIATISR